MSGPTRGNLTSLPRSPNSGKGGHGCLCTIIPRLIAPQTTERHPPQHDSEEEQGGKVERCLYFVYIYIIFNGSLERHRKLCIEKNSGFRASEFIDHIRAQGALSNAGWSMDSGNKPKQPKLKVPNNKIHVLAADSEGIWLQVTVPRKIDPPKSGVPGEVSPGCLLMPQAWGWPFVDLYFGPKHPHPLLSCVTSPFPSPFKVSFYC